MLGLMVSGGFWSITVEKAWYQEHMVAFTAAGADIERPFMLSGSGSRESGLGQGYVELSRGSRSLPSSRVTS